MSSSSSRVLSRRSRSTGTISRFGRPFDEDDEAEAEALLVGAVELGELGENIGIVVGPLLGRAPRGEPLAAARSPDALRALRASPPRSASAITMLRVLERVVDLGEPLDERRSSFEELGELVGRQLPR